MCPTLNPLERVDADSTTVARGWAPPTPPTQRSRAPRASRASATASKPEALPENVLLAESNPKALPKRSEPEEADRSQNLSHGPTTPSSASRRDSLSPTSDLPTTVDFSPDPTAQPVESVEQPQPIDSDGKGQSSTSAIATGWSESEGSDLQEVDRMASPTNAAVFRAPKARLAGHGENSAWNVPTATTSAFSSKSGNMVEDCALALPGGASKPLAFGPHSLKQESLYDDAKNLTDYQAYGATVDPSVSVVNATNPFSVPIPSAGSSYGYGYASMFPETKTYNAGWNDTYVDPNFSQFQGLYTIAIFSKTLKC